MTITSKLRSFCAAILYLAAAVSGAAETSSSTAEAQRKFQDARFGMFIHWGLYSTLSDQEWIMHNKKIPVADYEHLANGFYPSKFDAEQWVALAKAAGMRYITFTSKHHDGFAMWDSKVSNYDIVESTPYKRDVIKELADVCHREQMPLFLYHSHLDWHHPDYFPRGSTGKDTGRPEKGDWYKYLDYMDTQLTELLTGYGPIAGIWFDGHWDKPEADWRLQRTYDMIHKLQPSALVGNNHHLKPFPGEDFQMYERDLPGQNHSGFNKTTVLGDLPLETCDTINGSWGYTITDRNYKSTRDLVRYLSRAAGHGGNFLLNVGPTSGGEIMPEFEKRLREMGGWLNLYGDAIYGTTAGPVPPQAWGLTTRKGSKVYVHVHDYAEPTLAIGNVEKQVMAAHDMFDDTPLNFQQDQSTVTITLRPATPDLIARIAVLELAP